MTDDETSQPKKLYGGCVIAVAIYLILWAVTAAIAPMQFRRSSQIATGWGAVDTERTWFPVAPFLWFGTSRMESGGTVHSKSRYLIVWYVADSYYMWHEQTASDGSTISRGSVVDDIKDRLSKWF